MPPALTQNPELETQNARAAQPYSHARGYQGRSPCIVSVVTSSMSCPVCQNPVTSPALTGSDLLFETTSKRFTLDSCGSCNCLFLNPMPGSDEIAGFYPPQYWWDSSGRGPLKKLESVYRKLALYDHVSFIRRAAGKQSPVDLLDVGCGTGTLLGLLQEHGFRTAGVDLSEDAARLAEARSGVRVVAGSLGGAGFPDRSFDVVTLFHVMEHVTNPRQLLAEVSRILKPDGVIVLQVPNIDSWQFRVFRGRWYGLDIPRHVIDYSQGSIWKLLTDSGFLPGRTKHFNLRDNAPALASSLFPSLDPLSRAARERRTGVPESQVLRWSRHVAYLACVICAYPFAIMESVFGRGATVMIEARKA
jgi:2-polyprenyl-3-methyl-5-hydroxy-6-metoxy-1,4-benzoquinol methylase